ncbi:GNAT family N-acetyltransferase [Dokdonia sinensis]|nr:GNAT family protein [Dokdonia sinensis]
MKGDKVYLRILEKTDIHLTQKWINDSVISEIMGYLPVLSFENQLEWYDSIKNDKTRYVFAICRIDNDKHIGNVGLGNIDYINRHCMFNIFIATNDNRSGGMGSESTRLILNFAFERLNLNKVFLQTSERFLQANKMYLKLGFQIDGVLREHYYSNRSYENKLVYSILKREFYG